MVLNSVLLIVSLCLDLTIFISYLGDCSVALLDLNWVSCFSAVITVGYKLTPISMLCNYLFLFILGIVGFFFLACRGHGCSTSLETASWLGVGVKLNSHASTHDWTAGFSFGLNHLLLEEQHGPKAQALGFWLLLQFRLCVAEGGSQEPLELGERGEIVHLGQLVPEAGSNAACLGIGAPPCMTMRQSWWEWGMHRLLALMQEELGRCI